MTLLIIVLNRHLSRILISGYWMSRKSAMTDRIWLS